MREAVVLVWLKRHSPCFWALAVLLVAAFAMGGGARGDIQSLIVLRPLAILLLGFGLLSLRWAHVAANRFLFGMALAIVALLVLHLIPLPPGWWGSLPGRDLVVRIDAAAGLGQLWRPLSLAPDATLNALYAAMVPLAALVLGVQLDRRERHGLLGLLLTLGGISALLGLAQSIGGAQSALRFYKVTNDFGAVGLFANRNHQALLLVAMLPMIATWATSGERARDGRNSRKFLGLLAGITLLPFILVTGSRAGLILGVAAILLLPAVLLRNPTGQPALRREIAKIPERRRSVALILAVATVGVLIVALTIWLGRGTAVNRLLESAPGEDLRFLIIPALVSMSRFYLPLGAGLGSFERVYQIHEPSELLIVTYANHAHNDWFELAVTGGIPALILLLVAMVAFLAKARELFAARNKPSAELRFARLGLAVILLCALASMGDYPLRVPSLACLFVVALLWIGCPLPKNQPIAQVT
jgi:O-antigen ligase